MTYKVLVVTKDVIGVDAYNEEQALQIVKRNLNIKDSDNTEVQVKACILLAITDWEREYIKAPLMAAKIMKSQKEYATIEGWQKNLIQYENI